MPTPSLDAELTLVVADRTSAGEDVVLLELRAGDDATLPEWAPGAHIDLDLGDGTDGLVRQYSLCGDPADRRVYRIGILLEKDGRGGSKAAFALVKGDTVGVRGPRNHFELVASDRYLFVAGGIGITPILTMVREAEASGAQWELVYGGRSRDTMTFVAELEALAPGRVTVYPQDECGLIDLARHLGVARPDTLVYSCGPEPLLDAVEAIMASWPADALHVERFTPKTLDEPVRRDSFEVELAQTGTVVTVPPDRSILDVVTEAGVDVLSSCTEGTCGSCETPVLSGAIEHRDSLLSPAEQQAGDTMMICVSRAAGARLVLDL